MNRWLVSVHLFLCVESGANIIRHTRFEHSQYLRTFFLRIHWRQMLTNVHRSGYNLFAARLEKVEMVFFVQRILGHIDGARHRIHIGHILVQIGDIDV